MEGNDSMWKAYLIEPSHPEVSEFIKQVHPAIQADIHKASELVVKEQYDQAMSHIKRG